MPIHNGELHIRGTSLAVRDNLFSLGGDHAGKPALIWGHCLLGSMAQDDAAQLLDWEELERDVRLVRYDARGHGQSHKCTSKGAYVYEELKEDLIGVADRSNLRKFAVGGVSMGSALALHVATSFPERVSALVLMAPPTAWETRAPQTSRYRNIARGVRMGGLAPIKLLGALSRFRNTIPTDASPVSILARTTVENAKYLDRRSAAATFLGAAASDLPSQESLKALQQPTLILAWYDDDSHPKSTADRLAALIPNSELHFLRDGEDIHQWTTLIHDFLHKHR